MYTAEQRDYLNKLRRLRNYHLDALRFKFGTKTNRWKESDHDFIMIERINAEIARATKEFREKNGMPEKPDYQVHADKTTMAKALKLLRMHIEPNQVSITTRVSHSKLYDLAKMHRISVKPAFEYEVKFFDTKTPSFYTIAKAGIAPFFGYTSTTVLSDDFFKKRGCKLVNHHVEWDDVPIGSYFSLYVNDNTKMKRDEKLEHSKTC